MGGSRVFEAGGGFCAPLAEARPHQLDHLGSEQKTYVRDEIRKAQTQFTDAQWQLQDATEIMSSLLEQSPVDEQQVLDQLEIVLDAERKIKRTQLTLMIRIKNNLTPEQQARLQELRPKAPPPPEAPPPY